MITNSSPCCRCWAPQSEKRPVAQAKLVRLPQMYDYQVGLGLPGLDVSRGASIC
jgi:hypothetical protein